jgi:hypothetical protein
MNTVKQTPQSIEFINTTPLSVRVIFVLLALIPLPVPYELLIKPSWQGEITFGLIFALAISIGAVVISLGFFLAALFGWGEQHFRFDASKRQLTYKFKKAFTPGFKREFYSFDQIEALEIKIWETSEGAHLYDIAIKIAGKPEMRFGNFPSRSDAERYLAVLQNLLAKRK